MKRSQRLLVIAAVCVAGVVSGTALVAASSDDVTPAAGSFAALAAVGSDSVEPQLRDLAQHVGATGGETTSMRILNRDLGPFNSRVVAFAAKGGRTICYSLLGERVTDPGTSYCYQPNGRLPARLTGQHFNVMAPQHVVDGEIGVQVFGLAFDDVVSVRVDVNGAWLPARVVNNSFYLHLPGVGGRQLGIVEATLASGATQRHDLRTGG